MLLGSMAGEIRRVEPGTVYCSSCEFHALYVKGVPERNEIDLVCMRRGRTYLDHAPEYTLALI